MRRLALVALLLACQTRAAITIPRSTRWPDLGHEFRLDVPIRAGSLDANGVRLILLPDATASVVRVDVRVDVGSRDEPADKPGLAHLVEHMVFLSRDERGPTLGAELARATIRYNAFTTEDATEYQNLLVPEALDEVLRLEALRARRGCQGLDEAILARERDVVRNELRQRGYGEAESWPDLVRRRFYGDDHPYTRQVGGGDTAVAGLSLADVCGFLEREYTPGRMIVVVSGGFDVEQVTQLISRHFGELPARASPPHREMPARPGGPRRFEETWSYDETAVVLALPAPSLAEPLGFEIEELAPGIAEVAEVGLADEPSVDGVFATVVRGDRQPMFLLVAFARTPEEVGAVERAVKLFLARMADEAHESEHADRRIFGQLGYEYARAAAVRLMHEIESPGERAELYASYAQLAPGHSPTADLARLRDLDETGVARMFARLTASPATTVIFRPGKERRGDKLADALDPLPPEAPPEPEGDPEEARKRLGLPARRIHLPPAHRFVLENGLQVVLQSAPSLFPTASTRLEFAAGEAHVGDGQAGLADITARLFARGDFDTVAPSEVEKASLRPTLGYLGGELIGAYLSAFADLDSTTIVTRHLRINTPEVLHELAFRGNAFFQPGDAARLLANLDRGLAEGPRGELNAVDFAVRAALYGPRHPYARHVGLSARSLLAIGTRDVVEFMNRHYVARNARLVVTGDFRPEELAALEAGIRDEFGRWPAGERTAPIGPTLRPRSAPVFVGIDQPASGGQLEVALAYPSPAGVDGQHVARQVLAEMLGLRAEAVRTRLGAAYAPSARHEEHIGPGAYRVDMRVAAERAGPALRLLREGVDGLRAADGWLGDFARARRSIAASLLGRATTAYGIASLWAYLLEHGLPEAWSDKALRLAANLSPEQMRELIAAELVPEREILVVSGPRAEVEKAFAEAGLPAPAFMKNWPPKD